MSNQLHGLKFEEMIVSQHLSYDNSLAQEKDGYGSELDGYDFSGLPMQIKTKKVNSLHQIKNLNIEMASAPVFFKQEKQFPYRLIVGFYLQEQEHKKFFLIYEWPGIEKSKFELLKGDLSEKIVFDFEQKIKEFAAGKHGPARIWASQRNQEIKAKYKTNILLHPKIDSKNQRRLQCSVKIKDLIEICGQPQMHAGHYFNLKLPFHIKGGIRKFS